MKYAQAFIKSQLPDVNVIKILFFLMSDIFANKAKCVAFLCSKKKKKMGPKSTEILCKEDF